MTQNLLLFQVKVISLQNAVPSLSLCKFSLRKVGRGNVLPQNNNGPSTSLPKTGTNYKLQTTNYKEDKKPETLFEPISGNNINNQLDATIRVY